MNKVMEAALDIVGGTEIGKQVTDLKDNVMDTVGVKAETKEALQEANLDQVASTYEALAAKVGVTEKDIIKDFVSKGKNKDKFIELHTKIKSLAQKWWADISKLDGVLTTHELTWWSTIWFTIANAVGKVWWFARKAMEKLNLIHSSKDLGKMVFAINEVTTKVDVSKLDGKWEDNKDEEFNEWEVRTIWNEEILASSIEVSAEAKAVIDYAETFYGMKYKLGWKGYDDKIDCSKFTELVIEEWGIKKFDLPARDQINNKMLLDRSPNDVKQWDLVFFKNKTKAPIGKVSHVGFVSAMLNNGSYVILDASTNTWKVDTRVIAPTSDRYEYIFKDTSKLFQDIDTQKLVYNEYTGKSVDGTIQAA